MAILALTHHAERFFSPALVYLVMGCAGALGASAIGAHWLALGDDAVVVERVSEITVLMALFATGLRIDHRLSPREWGPTARLLAIVMPLTIAAVAVAGHWGLGLSAGAAVVLAAGLSPTDPVLAGDLGVRGPGEGDRSEPAFALTAEAGLNDGLAFPFVLLGLVIAGGADAGSLGEWLAWNVAWGISAALLLGAGIGWGIATLAVRLRDRGLVAVQLDGWAAVGAVLTIYGVCEAVGAYGFLAVFAGGLAFRRAERDHEYNEGVHRGAEGLERALELAMILFLGSLLTLDGLRIAGWRSVALALGLILVIRPAAALVAFARSRMPVPERLYVGIFGIRGIGSVYYAAAAVGSGLLSVGEGRVVVWTTAVVVCVSIVLHGLAATPLTRRMTPGEEPAGEPERVPDEAVV